MNADITIKEIYKAKVQYLCDIEPFMQGQQKINSCCDFDMNLIILAGMPTNEKYPKLISNKKREFNVIRVSANNNQPELINLPKTRFDIQHFQSLKDNRWILSTNYAPHWSYGDKINAFIWNSNNKKIETFLSTGSDITCFQATKDDFIWTGYHINGKYGHNDISRKRLTCLDSKGELLFDFTESMEEELMQEYKKPQYPKYEDYEEDDEIDGIFDSCDGMNITADGTVWTYWFNDDILLKIKDFKFEAMFTQIPGFFYYEFAILKDWALFSKFDDKELYLYSLANRDLYKILPVDENGNLLEFNDATAKDKTTYLLNDTKCYKLNLDNLLKQLSFI